MPQMVEQETKVGSISDLKNELVAQEIDIDNMLLEMATKQGSQENGGAPNAAFDNSDAVAVQEGA